MIWCTPTKIFIYVKIYMYCLIPIMYMVGKKTQSITPTSSDMIQSTLISGSNPVFSVLFDLFITCISVILLNFLCSYGLGALSWIYAIFNVIFA